MTSKKEKKYDSVKMMRDIRDKLSKKYFHNPDKEMKDLEIIRNKYGMNSKGKVA